MGNNTQQPEGWEVRFSKYYGAMFECGDFEQLMDDIRAEIEAARREEFEYQLTFWRDKEGTPNLRETSNGFTWEDVTDFILFGQHIADSDLLNEGDRRCLAAFCEAYLMRLNMGEKGIWPKGVKAPVSRKVQSEQLKQKRLTNQDE